MVLTKVIYVSRVRTEKEAELSALETYWKDRLGAMEQEHVDRQKLTEKEVSTRTAYQTRTSRIAI